MLTTIHQVSIASENHNNKAKILPSFLIVLYIALTYSSTYIEGINNSIGWYSALFISILLIILAIRESGVKILNRELGFYSLVLILFLISIIYNENVPYTSLLQYFRFILPAMALVRLKLNKKVILIAYYSFCAYFIVMMLRGVDPTTLVIGVSRNIVSIHLLFFVCLYFIATGGKVCIKEAIAVLCFCIIICVWTGCRSGVIATAVILLGIVFSIRNIKTKFLLIICACIFLATIITVFLMEQSSSAIQAYLFHITGKAGVADNPRVAYINEYLSLATNNLGNFFLGVRFTSMETIANTAYNPHNSFLCAHAKMGLLYFCLIVFGIAKQVIKLLKRKSIFAFLLIAISIRALTDSIAFNGLYDILFYYFIIERDCVNKDVYIGEYDDCRC